MPEPLIVSPEQMAIINEIKALDARFGADKTLFHSRGAIASAKQLMERASDAGLDQRAFFPLQMWISLHDNEQDLPEHLKSWQARP